ncbi:MAG: glutamine--tRNA ligase/YqeY domain fusion protein [Desulfovibrionaceae bacterium]
MKREDNDMVYSSSDFIRTIIRKDQDSGKYNGRVHTRFPPEPNGYLHIGHAKSICLNFGIAQEYNALCNLRMDDTNPVKEDNEYVEAIKKDIEWLGFMWSSLHFSSDYFEKLYSLAEILIQKEKAYVDELSYEEIREHRGTLTQEGKESPYRNRATEENLELFRKMKAGEFEDGKYVLRAKISMSSPNMVMRDPVLYRIRNIFHHRTADTWCIYPMYDFTHCISDSLEGITHSLCSLEFENNRELYDWILEELSMYRPQQIEFARLHLSHTVLSKRKLIRLVQEGYVDGWDDPRMPTISGMKRRGYPPESIRKFCSSIGVSRAESLVDMGMLEHSVREVLNEKAKRLMVVQDPLRVVIENFPEGQREELEMPYFPEDTSRGTRKAPFTKILYIEKDDFMQDAPKKFFRLSEGREVRLRYAYYITCTGVIKDANGEIIEIRCTYDPETKGGTSLDGRKVKGTLHWVSAEEYIPITVRLYDTLFTIANPDKIEEGKDFVEYINPDAMIEKKAYAEMDITQCLLEEQIQFERLAYYVLDKKSEEGFLVFNRIVSLKDTWAKVKDK